MQGVTGRPVAAFAACYHPTPPPLTMRSASSLCRTRWFRLPRVAVFVFAAVVVPSCMPKTPVVTPAAAPTTAAVPAAEAWEQKLAWIVRLEDQRLLRDPNPPAPKVLTPATAKTPAVLAPP